MGTFCQITAASTPLEKYKDMATILKYDRPLFSLELSGKNIRSQTSMKKKEQSRTTDPEHSTSGVSCIQKFSNF